MRKGATILFLLFSLSTLTALDSCKKSADEVRLTPLKLNVPPGFPTPVYNFEGNPLTQQGFDLGKALFYDGKLSKDGNFPCASCHQQFAAFSTFDHDFSHGFNNQLTTRNAPGLFNLAWQKEFQWDGGVNHIEVQPLAPITAPNEMAEDINTVINKLKADQHYKRMFREAFGDDEINSQRMLKAIAQFVGSMVSADSKYDKVKRGEKSFSLQEARGYSIFQTNCASCHKEPLFTDLSYRNTGLPVSDFLQDYGRMKITHKKEDSIKFRVPSLRNVLVTYPYGHDGRFYTIDQVLNHYTRDIVNTPDVDPLVKNKIVLSIQERSDLKQFLATLTDSTFINDKRFSQPQ